MTTASFTSLMTDQSTTTLTPGFEGANIGTIIGFKHVNYMIERAVIEHFRTAGLPVGGLYEQCGLGFDVISLDTRLQTALLVDDEARVECRPTTKPGASMMTFKVQIHVDRDGESKKAVTSTVGIVFRSDVDKRRMTQLGPVPEVLEPFVVEAIGADDVVVPAKTNDLISGGSTDDDVKLSEMLQGQNGYAWKFRIRYPYVHYFDRMPMSGYLRLMEESKHRFVDARGISIRELLESDNWIPAVTKSSVEITGEARLEEDLYISYVVEDVFKNLLYTSRVTYQVERGGEMVTVAVGSITHAYGVVENGKEGKLVEWDERVARAISGPGSGA